jgi:hypothetical protein
MEVPSPKEERDSFFFGDKGILLSERLKGANQVHKGGVPTAKIKERSPYRNKVIKSKSLPFHSFECHLNILYECLTPS